MRLGLFLMPSHPPERDLKEGFEWDLRMIREADRLGYDEAWVGEHFTSPWEPNPAPDLLLAQALTQTEKIALCPGAHLLPFHHPAELACRVALMDHLARGRYMLGIGASGLPSDWELFQVDGVRGETRAMMREALEIMLRIWTSDGGLDYSGQFWKVRVPNPMLGVLRHHLKPYQKPHPPIGIAGLSPGSETLELAGEYGFLPLSVSLSPAYIASHWEAVERGAARAGRRPPERQSWRIVREVFVARTDEEALERSIGGPLGRMEREYLMPLLKGFNFTQYLKEDPSTPDEMVTPEFLARTSWLIGSPETVARRLLRTYRQAGGFGTLLVLCYDYADAPAPWFESLRLLKEEVVPGFYQLLAEER